MCVHQCLYLTAWQEQETGEEIKAQVKEEFKRNTKCAFSYWFVSPAHFDWTFNWSFAPIWFCFDSVIVLKGITVISNLSLTFWFVVVLTVFSLISGNAFLNLTLESHHSPSPWGILNAFYWNRPEILYLFSNHYFLYLSKIGKILDAIHIFHLIGFTTQKKKKVNR